MADDDGFIPNEDDEWKTDEFDEEAADEFPVDVDEDEKMPVFKKDGSAAKTIFVTYQFRHFQDDYKILGSLGEPGQFGVAYECYQNSDPFKTRKCVKEINKARFHHIDTDARNDILKTMQNEIAILRKVDHPNIVKLFDVYEDRHKLHLVMEFLPGGELFARICEKESFSEKEAVRILKQILEALDHMHDKNILHLDLKPDNILFADKDDDAPIKLIDFGMARVVPRLAKLKDRVGTPNYMAPEVFEGNYSKAADIWSVGIITFCMIFGFPPFYVDEDDIHLDEHKALEIKIKQGFDATVKEGFGAFFPESVPVSEECKYLLSKMLEMDVKKRWTAKECLSSVWVRGFENASEKTIPPIVRDALKKFHATSKFKVAISNLFTHQIDEDHIKEIRKFFNKMDVNKDGSISLKEFKDGMKEMNTDLSDEQLEMIFSNVDMDDDREITFEELLTITAHRMLVDEDERLYQAFQDLDEDGDGLISREELQNAIDSFEFKTNKVNTDDNIQSDPRAKKHVRQSTIMLKRFQSAFHQADKNGDGQLDYEEFLRILHPEFGDDTATLAEFKSNVTDSTRVRGAQFNVDYQTATASGYVEVKPSPRVEPVGGDQGLTVPSQQKMKTLTLDAFKKKKSVSNVKEDESETKQMRETVVQQKIEIKALKEENAKLKEKLESVEQSREEMRHKYETEMFDKFEQQKIEMNNMKKQWEEVQNKGNQQNIGYQDKLKEKDNQIHEKDVLIANLNMLLDKRNTEIERMKKELQSKSKELQSKSKDINNLEITLQHAVESKMKSLVQSQSEIAKLKTMLSGGSIGSQTVPFQNGYESASAATSPTSYNGKLSNHHSFPKQSNGKKKKARHLSHLIGD